MKRLHIITKPTTIDALDVYDADEVESSWQLKAERLLARRARNFKHQMS